MYTPGDVHWDTLKLDGGDEGAPAAAAAAAASAPSTAFADTDTPETLLELIKQRRRWLNGSFFALLYYLKNFGKFLHTRHGPLRKLVSAASVLSILFVYV